MDDTIIEHAPRDNKLGSGLDHDLNNNTLESRHCGETRQLHAVPRKPLHHEWSILACHIIANLVVVSNSDPHFSQSVKRNLPSAQTLDASILISVLPVTETRVSPISS